MRGNKRTQLKRTNGNWSEERIGTERATTTRERERGPRRRNKRVERNGSRFTLPPYTTQTYTTQILKRISNTTSEPSRLRFCQSVTAHHHKTSTNTSFFTTTTPHTVVPKAASYHHSSTMDVHHYLHSHIAAYLYTSQSSFLLDLAYSPRSFLRGKLTNQD